MSINADFFSLATIYQNICTRSLSADEFGQIISDNVTLNHQTNDEQLIQAEGREAVTELFSKYLFSNTSNITVHGRGFLPVGTDKIIVKLTKSADKQEDNKLNRYKFLEDTSLSFTRTDDDKYKIASITMIVKRTFIQTIST